MTLRTLPELLYPAKFNELFYQASDIFPKFFNFKNDLYDFFILSQKILN